MLHHFIPIANSSGDHTLEYLKKVFFPEVGATNPKTGHPLAPSRQLLAQWIVKAWAKVPKALVRKSWELCGYKSTEDLSNEEETATVAVINYSQEQLVTMIENIAGYDAIMEWIDEANDRQPLFPKEDNDVSWDVGTDQGFVMCR